MMDLNASLMGRCDHSVTKFSRDGTVVWIELSRIVICASAPGPDTQGTFKLEVDGAARS